MESWSAIYDMAFGDEWWKEKYEDFFSFSDLDQPSLSFEEWMHDQDAQSGALEEMTNAPD